MGYDVSPTTHTPHTKDERDNEPVKGCGSKDGLDAKRPPIRGAGHNRP